MEDPPDVKKYSQNIPPLESEPAGSGGQIDGRAPESKIENTPEAEVAEDADHDATATDASESMPSKKGAKIEHNTSLRVHVSLSDQLMAPEVNWF